MRLPLSIDVQYHSELEQLALPVNPHPFEEGMTVTDQRISAQRSAQENCITTVLTSLPLVGIIRY